MSDDVRTFPADPVVVQRVIDLSAAKGFAWPFWPPSAGRWDYLRGPQLVRKYANAICQEELEEIAAALEKLPTPTEEGQRVMQCPRCHGDGYVRREALQPLGRRHDRP